MQYKRGICDGKNEESVSKNIVCVCVTEKPQPKSEKSKKRDQLFFRFENLWKCKIKN